MVAASREGTRLMLMGLFCALVCLPSLYVAYLKVGKKIGLGGYMFFFEVIIVFNFNSRLSQNWLFVS